MTRSTRLHSDNPADPMDNDAIALRLDAQDQAIASLHASLSAILTRLDALVPPTNASAADSSAAASILGRPPAVDPTLVAPLPLPLANRPGLSLDIPSFADVDPMGWIVKAEQYFDLHSTLEQDKVAQVFVGLDGSALHWAR
ncbi:hypothetical protein KSP39_PZI021726 [Platanthera zijinensis]|uniref:Uncharacterized protein n=1 Tax=Platanthera zijinensis TaxID=2320716 RepID=A0AAP0AYS5_9ASPA